MGLNYLIIQSLRKGRSKAYDVPTERVCFSHFSLLIRCSYGTWEYGESYLHIRPGEIPPVRTAYDYKKNRFEYVPWGGRMLNGIKLSDYSIVTQWAFKSIRRSYETYLYLAFFSTHTMFLRNMEHGESYRQCKLVKYVL